jgi:pyruvate formate lyase activating enzyme
MTGRIFNIQRFSVNDGPGIRTTVFLKGCPLNCAWCHNPESISPEKEVLLYMDRCIRCGKCVEICHHHAAIPINGAYGVDREQCTHCGECVDECVSEARNIVGRDMMVKEVMEEILKDQIYYEQSGGGVTFSGGEPLLQHEFLIALLTECRKEGIHTAVDTTGLTSPDILRKVAEQTDLFLYDIKTMDDGRHRQFTGVSNRPILDNLRLLDEWNKRVIIRVPVIPGVNMDLVSIGKIGEFSASLKNIREINLLPYHKTGIGKYGRIDAEYLLEAAEPPTEHQMSRVVEKLKPYGLQIAIGG